jgi:hypothetical protein
MKSRTNKNSRTKRRQRKMRYRGGATNIISDEERILMMTQEDQAEYHSLPLENKAEYLNGKVSPSGIVLQNIIGSITPSSQTITPAPTPIILSQTAPAPAPAIAPPAIAPPAIAPPAAAADNNIIGGRYRRKSRGYKRRQSKRRQSRRQSRRR